MGLIRKAVTTVTNEVINQASGRRHDDEVIDRARNVERIRRGTSGKTGA